MSRVVAVHRAADHVFSKETTRDEILVGAPPGEPMPMEKI